ncbi:MAG: FkbM family methyltransferase [Planctomycetota bacterium]
MTTEPVAGPWALPDARPTSARERRGQWASFLLRSADVARAGRVFGPRLGGPPDVVSRSWFGHRLHVDVSRSLAQRLVFLLGERSLPEASVVRSLLAPGMVAVDVGANIGYWTLFLCSRVGTSGQVVAYEPSPENLPELEANIARNGLAQVTVRPVAVGARAGVVSFLSGINGGVAEGDGGPHLCPVVTLDELRDRPVDFVKIDVEGYEGAVLEGARELIRRQRPVLWIEFHPQLVRAHGFSYDALLGDLAPLYPRSRLFASAEAASPGRLRRMASRYGLGRALVEVADPAGDGARALVAGQDAVWLCCDHGRGAEQNCRLSLPGA